MHKPFFVMILSEFVLAKSTKKAKSETRHKYHVIHVVIDAVKKENVAFCVAFSLNKMVIFSWKNSNLNKIMFKLLQGAVSLFTSYYMWSFTKYNICIYNYVLFVSQNNSAHSTSWWVSVAPLRAILIINISLSVWISGLCRRLVMK